MRVIVFSPNRGKSLNNIIRFGIAIGITQQEIFADFGEALFAKIGKPALAIPAQRRLLKLLNIINAHFRAAGFGRA